MIEVKGLTRFYADRPTIQDLTFSVPRGQVLGFLGLALTQRDQGTIIFITIFLMPALIVFAGVMVWWRRRLFR